MKCNIESRIGWVSMEEIDYFVNRMGVERYTLTSINSSYGVEME